MPLASGASQLAAAELCLLNRARQQAGVATVALNATLAQTATDHSRDMVARRYFAHQSPDGTTPDQRISQAGYAFSSMGESMAWGSEQYGTPAQAFQSQMDDPPHRAILLSRDYREVGVGVAIGAPDASAQNAATYTLDFGTRSAG